jgi:hypothetical protein
VRRIAEIHGGTVEAIPLQQGVTFRISLPEIADRGAVVALPSGPTQQDARMLQNG